MTLELAPGSVATEGALIERLGLGRTPVREAIQRLAWEGLLEIRPRAGLAIAPLHAGRLAARARRASRRRDRACPLGGPLRHPRGRRPFPDAALAMQKAVISGDVLAFLEADKALDEAMALAADNPFAARARRTPADPQPPLLVPLQGRHRPGRIRRAPCRADPRRSSTATRKARPRKPNG